MTNKKKTGLGRGLDSLIPILPDDVDESEENSSLTLEDMLEAKDNENEEKDTKLSKEKNNNKELNSKIVANKSLKSQKTTTVEETEIKKPKTSRDELDIEKPSSSESIANRLETKNQVESSQNNKETHQSSYETQENSNTKNTNTPTEVSQPVAKNLEVAKANELESNNLQESKSTVEEIRENLTEREKESIDEVIKIIGKNPRITLWSAKSAAVFRYLRKTEPEFSISKEASKLIDEAVQSKYPEIWTLFKDIEK